MFIKFYFARSNQEIINDEDSELTNLVINFCNISIFDGFRHFDSRFDSFLGILVILVLQEPEIALLDRFALPNVGEIQIFMF